VIAAPTRHPTSRRRCARIPTGLLPRAATARAVHRFPAFVAFVLGAWIAALSGCGDDEAPRPEASEAPVPSQLSQESQIDPSPQQIARIFRGEEPASAHKGILKDGVAGRVLDPDGRPLAGAEVILLRYLSPWPEERAAEVAHVFSGKDGSFRFAATRDEDLALEVVHTGMARERVVAPKVLESVDIRLAPGFEVSGVVRFASAGQIALRGVPVYLEPGTWGTRRAVETLTDDHGRFLFSNVPAGAARLTVRALGLAPATVSSVNVGGGPISVSPHFPGSALRGIVRRAHNGEPLAGAEVRLYPSTAWNKLLYAPALTTTSAEGVFVLTALAPGPAFLVVSHPEHTTLSRPIAVADGQPSQDIELGRRSALRVKLSGAIDGRIALRLASASGEMHRARADELGRVVFDQTIGAGPATLEVIDGIGAFAASSARSMDVSIDESGDTTLELELVAPTVIAGRVVDDAGQPLAGVLLATPRHRLQPRNPESWYAASSADGRFELRGLPPGRSILRLSREGFAARMVEATVGAAGSRVELGDVALERPGTIRGVVLQDGNGFAGANVFASREGDTAVNAVSGRDGSFGLHGLAAGRYRVMARSGSSPVQVYEALVAVEAGGETTGIELTLSPGRRVRGQVTGNSGVPVPDATICVVGATAAIASTDQNGTFDMEVPQGEVELQAFSSDFRSTATEVIGPNMSSITIRLPFVSLGGLDARVSAALRGRLPTRVILGVTPLDMTAEGDPIVRRLRSKRVLVDLSPSGRLMADQLPAGRARLEIIAPGLGLWRTEVEVPSGTRLDLGALRLESGAELRGRITDAEGKPVVGAIVHLGEIEDLALDLAQQNRSDADGRFVLRGITPIGKRIVVAAQGYTTVVRDLVLPDDLLRREPYPVQLQPSSIVHVQLVAGGAPTAVFRVIALYHEDSFIGTRTTDVDGSLSFVADRPGRYRIGIFGEPDSKSVDVQIGETATRHAIELKLDG
jgi:hypothetical protein